MAKEKTARLSRTIIPSYVMDNIYNMPAKRLSRGLSRKDLAEMSGVKEGRIAGYENGTIAVARISYNKLAKVFDWQEWE